MAGSERLILGWFPIPNVAEDPEGLAEIRTMLNEMYYADEEFNEENPVESLGEVGAVEVPQNLLGIQEATSYPLTAEIKSSDVGQ